MKALGKTLFGDGRNVAVVAGLLVVELVLASAGLVREAAFAVPLLTLAAVTYLSRH